MLSDRIYTDEKNIRRLKCRSDGDYTDYTPHDNLIEYITWFDSEAEGYSEGVTAFNGGTKNFDYSEFFGAEGVRINKVYAYINGYVIEGTYATEYVFKDGLTDLPTINIDDEALVEQGYSPDPDSTPIDPRIAHINSLIDAIGDPQNTAEIEEIKGLQRLIKFYENEKSGAKFQAHFNFSSILDMQINQRIAFFSQQLEFAQTVTSPLVLDTDGNDFETKSKQDGIYFDLDNDGFAEKTAWTNGDAFLTYDLNENGKIDNGSELFGNHTVVGNEKAADGFAA
jgi:hypothetical protein